MDIDDTICDLLLTVAELTEVFDFGVGPNDYTEMR